MANYTKIPAGTNQSQQLAMINKNFSQLNNDNVFKLYNDNNGVPNIAIGVQADGKSRIKIAKDGIDVTTATDDQLVFNSSQNSFKILDTDTVQLFVPSTLTSGTTITATVPHGLQVVPAVIAYLSGTGSNFLSTNTYYSAPYQAPIKVGSTGYEPGLQFSYRMDGTNVYFDVANYSSIGVADIGIVTFKYYILQETAN